MNQPCPFDANKWLQQILCRADSIEFWFGRPRNISKSSEVKEFGI